MAWRYGLGRVVVVLTDDGKIYGGELLSKSNTPLLVRSMGWAVGDPERKSDSYISIDDAHLGKKTEIAYKGKNPPSGDGIVFVKTDKDLYSSYIETTSLGYHNLLGVTYAVNQPEEYKHVGFNPDVVQLALQSNGKVFDANDVLKMADAIRSQSQGVTLEKWHYQWPFVLAALLLFLIEVCIRRVVYFKE